MNVIGWLGAHHALVAHAVSLGVAFLLGCAFGGWLSRRQLVRLVREMITAAAPVEAQTPAPPPPAGRDARGRFVKRGAP